MGQKDQLELLTELVSSVKPAALTSRNMNKPARDMEMTKCGVNVLLRACFAQIKVSVCLRPHARARARTHTHTQEGDYVS